MAENYAVQTRLPPAGRNHQHRVTECKGAEDQAEIDRKCSVGVTSRLCRGDRDAVHNRNER